MSYEVTEVFEEVRASFTKWGIEESPRVFMVTNCTGAVENRVARAILRCPRRLSVHNRFPSLFVDRVEAAMIDVFTAKVVCIYAPASLIEIDEEVDPTTNENSSPRLRVSSRLINVRTQRDVDGVALVVPYFPALPGGLAGPPEDKSQRITTDIQVPTKAISYSRKEVGSPDAKADQFVGHVNSKGLFELPDSTPGAPKFRDKPRTWLCTKIEGVTEGRGPDAAELIYDVSYEFVRAPKGATWDTSELYHVTIDGVMPPDVELPVDPSFGGGTVPDERTTSTGEIKGAMIGVRHYPEADFGDLDLII